MDKKETIIINFIASPGCGKSTLTASVFSKLKWLGYDCEMVSEFAKELIWEERNETFKDETYLFAKQNHRLFRVNGKVDIIITDRPIILSILYNRKYGNGSKNFENLVYETHNNYKNLNYFINRTKRYNPNGRNQTEKESDMMNIEIKNILNEYSIPYNEINGNKEATDKIVEDIIKLF